MAQILFHDNDNLKKLAENFIQTHNLNKNLKEIMLENLKSKADDYKKKTLRKKIRSAN